MRDDDEAMRATGKDSSIDRREEGRARARSRRGRRGDARRARTDRYAVHPCVEPAWKTKRERARERETDETTRAFVRFDAQIAACVWSAFSIRKTETAHAAELKRLRETKTLAELMSLNMGA